MGNANLPEPHGEKTQQRDANIAPCAWPEIEAYRQEKYNEVEGRVRDSLSDKITHELGQLATAEPIALGIHNGEIPVGGDRNARNPGHD